MNLRIPVELKKALQHWCIDHDREMTDVIIEGIKRVIGVHSQRPGKK